MTERLLLLSALETSALVILAINRPGYTLAAILTVLGLCALAFLGGWWFAAWEAKEYNAERDYP